MPKLKDMEDRGVTNESLEAFKKAKFKSASSGGRGMSVATQYKCGGSHKYYNGGTFTGTTPLRYKRGGGARGKCYPYG